MQVLSTGENEVGCLSSGTANFMPALKQHCRDCKISTSASAENGIYKFVSKILIGGCFSSDGFIKTLRWNRTKLLVIC